MNTTLIRALLSASLASCAAAGAHAGQWQAEGVDAFQVAVYVDAGSIGPGAPGTVRITAMEDFARTEYLGEPVYPHRSRTTTFRVDCQAGELGYESWTLHAGPRGTGGVVWSAGAEEGVGMFRPRPGGAHAMVLERACDGPVVADAR